MIIAENFNAISTLKKGRPPRLPFLDFKNLVLGKNYQLSLVICGGKLSKKINREYRGKDAPANVLAFSLSPKIGEIYLNPQQARRDAPLFDQRAIPFTMRLFIHALLHLKGYEHGDTMEKRENNLMQRYLEAQTIIRR